MSLRTTRPHTLGARYAVIATAFLSTALVATAAPPANAAPAPKSAFSGSAYGSVVATDNVNSGYSSLIQACTQNRSVSYTNRAAQTSLASGLGRVGAVTTGAKTTPTSSSATSTTAGTRLLGGLIDATGITATSSVSAAARGTFATRGGVVFTDLIVAGRRIAASPPPNTVIQIPTVGKVTLNGQGSSTSMGTTRITVTALRVDVQGDVLLNRPAATIVVGRASASAHLPTLSLAAGVAYSSLVDLAGAANSGPTFPAYIPCGGTRGAVVRNAGASVAVPTVISTGTATNTAQSIETSTRTTTAVQSSMTGVNLLGGVVRADAITVRSTASRGTGKLSGTSSGSKIVGLKINGRAVAPTVKPNTVIPIPGVGSLTVFKTGASSTAYEVVGLELKLSRASGTLPVGARVRVAGASARVYLQP